MSQYLKYKSTATGSQGVPHLDEITNEDFLLTSSYKLYIYTVEYKQLNLCTLSVQIQMLNQKHVFAKPQAKVRGS